MFDMSVIGNTDIKNILDFWLRIKVNYKLDFVDTLCPSYGATELSK